MKNSNEAVTNSKDESKVIVKVVKRAPKSPVARVAEKYSALLAKQVVSEVTSETRKLAIIRCVNELSDVSLDIFQKELRKTMTQIIFDFQFLMDCASLDFDEIKTFNAALNVVLYNRLGKVKKQGLKIAFKNMEHLLIEDVYTEDELATVFYKTPASEVSDEQKTELSSFIKGAMELLPVINN